MDQTRDEETLMLRLQGKSFSTIARKLGLEGTNEAGRAFNRALRRRPAEEQEGLRQAELARLNALAETVKGEVRLRPEEQAQVLRAVERLRSMLLAE